MHALAHLEADGPGDPEQPPQHPVGAAAEQAGEPDDLARADPQHICCVRWCGQQHLAGCGRSGEHFLARAAGHRRHQIAGGEFTAPAHGCHPAVAQHGAAVGDHDHFVQPVRDVDDGGALGLHAHEHREQPLDLPLLQRRRRLVQNEDPASPPQRLGDRDQLALGEAEGADRAIGVGIEIELRQDVRGLAAHARAIDHRQRTEAAHGRIAERDVLRDRQGRHQAQLLRDRHDAGGDRIARAREMSLLAGDPDNAAVGTMDTRQNSDQRRFPGAVLTDDGVDLADADIEVDIVERQRRAELLADACCARRRNGHHRGTKATCIFSSVNFPRSMMTSLSSATVQSRIGTS